MGQFIFVRGCSEFIIRDLSCVDCAPYSVVTTSNAIEMYGAVEVDNSVNLDISLFNLTGCRTSLRFVDSSYPDGSAIMFAGPPSANDAISEVDYGNIVNCYGRTCIFSSGGRSPIITYCNFYSNRMDLCLFWCGAGTLVSQFCYFFGNGHLDGSGGTQFQTSTDEPGSITIRNSYFDNSLPSGNFYDSDHPCSAFATCTSFPLYHHHTIFCSGILLPTMAFSFSFIFTNSILFRASMPLSSSHAFTLSSNFTDSVPSVCRIPNSIVRYGLFSWFFSLPSPSY
jgi:hypothetical protein